MADVKRIVGHIRPLQPLQLFSGNLRYSTATIAVVSVCGSWQCTEQAHASFTRNETKGPDTVTTARHETPMTTTAKTASGYHLNALRDVLFLLRHFCQVGNDVLVIFPESDSKAPQGQLSRNRVEAERTTARRGESWRAISDIGGVERLERNGRADTPTHRQTCKSTELTAHCLPSLQEI